MWCSPRMSPTPPLLGGRNTPRRILARADALAAGQGINLDDGQRRLLADLASVASDALSQRGTATLRHQYVHGPPGRGKTWLMGLFHQAVQTKYKRRMHFHDFFRDLHARAHAAEPTDDGRPAVEHALDALLGDTRILCFDELHVHDPGDAMFFARTLKAVFARRILLVATSNYAPEDLLPSDYFHHLFEPTIELIKSRMRIRMLDAGTDYRTIVSTEEPGSGYSAGHLMVPGTRRQLDEAGLTIPSSSEQTTIRPTTHSFRALRAAKGQAWFDFRDICDAPSAASDYLHLARHHDHVVIDGIPAPGRADPSAWKRLANLIDVLYDRDIRTDLICIAVPDPGASGGHAVDTARRASRLAALRRPDDDTTLPATAAGTPPDDG